MRKERNAQPNSAETPVARPVIDKMVAPDISLSPNGNLHIHVPMLIRRPRGRKMVLAPAVEGEVRPVATAHTADPIIQALARAHVWVEMIESGQVESIGDLAGRLQVDPSYAGRILKLATAAPDIVESLLAGHGAGDVSLAKLVKELPMGWEEQRKAVLAVQTTDTYE